MTKNKKSLKYILIASLAVILVLVLLFTSYGQVFGEIESDGSTYIDDIQVFSGDSLDEAINKCKKANYIPVEKNINYSQKDGNTKDNGIYIVGYTTTDNADDGITGVSMLQMKNGYQDFTYGDIAQRMAEKLGNIPTELKYAIEELKYNYEHNSPAAKLAVEVLNCYNVPEQNNMKLGDYMVSGNCKVDFVKKVLSRASTSTISAFCNALVGGTSDNGDSKWATRINTTEVKSLLKDEDNYGELDNLYQSIASELVDSLQTFATKYNDAEKRYEQNKTVDAVEYKNTKSNDMPDKVVEDKTTGGEIKEEEGDGYYLYAMEVLNGYYYDKETKVKLGDYLVSLGESTYEKVDDLRKIYPLVDSLTDGQVATMRMSGVAFSALYLENEEGLLNQAEKQLESIKDDIKKGTQRDYMSVWVGVDQDLYEQKVAVTTDAYRSNWAGDIYDDLTSTDKLDDFISSAQSKLEIVMSVVSIGYGITYIATTVISHFFGFAVWGAASSMWAICCAGIGCGVFSTIFGVLGCMFIVLNYVVLIAMVVLFIVWLVKTLWDYFHDDDAEEFTEIPSIMFDVVNKKYVKYNVVKENGSAANINGDNARRWNALYYTKSSEVGEPICSSEINDLITVQYNDNSTPTGYTPVKCFGEVTAANLNANSKSDSAAIYMFCKGTTNAINEGEEDTTATKYLSKLSLSVESSETAAKAALTKSGYQVLDRNLTPITASIKKYTYLGFKTTTNPSDAITDIRVTARNSVDAFSYGNASYTGCGTTVTGDTLCYTCYSCAGSPILADIAIKYSLDDIPGDGYEPINLFCGGNAFNFNTGSESDNTIERSHYSEYSENWDESGVYLYFKPSVTYTAENSTTEYISGFVIVAGTEGDYDKADNYIDALHLKRYDQDLTYAAYYKLPTEAHGMVSTKRNCNKLRTYIAYTTTYNPYRAIYGISSYTSTPGNYSVPANLGAYKTTGAYAVCDVMFEMGYNLYEGGYQMRGFYDTHSYQFPNNAGENSGIMQENTYAALAPEDYENVSWSSCNGRGKGLYVLGPTKDKEPLTVDDVVVSNSSKAPEGYYSVEDFKTPNSTKSHNLGYNTTNSDYIEKGKELEPVYIYVKKSEPVEQTYISKISVASYTFDTVVGSGGSDYTDAQKKLVNVTGGEYCVQKLMSECTDEIVQANLAVSKSDSWYSDPDNVPSSISYIGVTRTSNQSEAIRGIIRYVTNSTSMPATIKVSGVEYKKAGDMIYDSKGSYYLYYSTSTGAKPGMPLTSITISDNVYEGSMATAMTANSTDIVERKIGDEVIQEGVKAKLYGDSKESAYVHMAYEESDSRMSAIYVGHGKTKAAAQADLLSLGCNFCVDLDVNKDAGGEYVYIGYSRYNLTASELKKNVAKYAVRDIILTVGEPHQSTITVPNQKSSTGKTISVVYRNAIDDYTSVTGNDGTKGVSLNSGTGGKQIYVYYTTTETADTPNPIKKLGLACRDFGMVNDDNNTWENVFDVNGNQVNLNEGAYGSVLGDDFISKTDNWLINDRVYTDTQDGTFIADNRIYLYATRENNQTRDGYAVDQTKINNEFVTYDVYGYYNGN